MTRQQGVPTLRAHRPDVQQLRGSQHRVGTSSGIHPEDRPGLTGERQLINRQPAYGDGEDDDALYNTRRSTSTRLYTPATKPPLQTVMRVTKHQGPPPRQHAALKQAPIFVQRRQRFHFSVYIGVAMVCMVIGWIIFSSFSRWWQGQQDAWQYGTPRTFQVDANVRHGGISHFTVENLNGHILVYEVVQTDLSKMHLYLGPVFSGAGSDLQPATISFEDINGDGYPDMLIAVGTGRYPLINDQNAFRPVNASDHLISGKGI